ncbi:Flp family type IVb pilin [Paraburkholderia sp. BCC1884]|uniref:Flp family type IVb pilin n=1 Tax=Paraburkholderia sp. BCC1884 TaxID=2562668 RepID=UPI001182BDA7|nr:Flp family type IVb pilin [Paraburkholderia sp. BCC1884]
MNKFTKRFLKDSKGVTAIEYGLIAGLIVLVIVTSVTNIGNNLESVFSTIATKITATPAA